MKKLISVLLLICTLILCITSCDNNNDNNDSYNDTNNDDIHSENCTTTGIHTYENGECTGCELKIFDVIKEYIIEHADPNNSGGGRYLYYCGSYTDDDNFTIWQYESSNNLITILARYRDYPHTYSTDLYLTPYTFEDGEFEWEGDCIKFGCDCTSLSGYLDPTKFSSSTNRLPHSSSASDADRMSEEYAKALKVNIQEEIIPFLSDVGFNITISDLGFKRFQ